MVVIASAANAASVTWFFQGNAYSGAIIGDLSGEVAITLDDEETPGSVNMRVDATELSDTGQDAITAIFLNTAFDSDTGFVQVAPTIGGNTYVSRANNEDGFSAGNTSPDFQDGPLFDLRLLFNTPTGGGDFLSVENPIFEATLTLTGGDLTVSDFFPHESTVNPNGMGDQGPFQVSLRAVQLPGGGDAYFAGVTPGLQIDDFNGGDVFPPLVSPGSSTDLYAGAVGGERIIKFGLGSNLGTELSVVDGVYTHDSGNIDSDSVIVWEGVAGSGLFEDFTNGGASDRIRLALEIPFLGPGDASPMLELFIRTSTTSGVTQGTFEFTADVSGIYDAPLDELAWDRPGNNPLDFEDVLSLQLTVRPRGADFVEIDNIATVPEPGAALLMGGALASLGVLRRRRTQRAVEGADLDVHSRAHRPARSRFS
jgi:hypothetical protein